MRLFEEVLEPGAAAVVWTDDPKSDEVIARCRGAGAEGADRRRAGRDAEARSTREPTQLGQKLTIEARGQDARRRRCALIGAYQAANALTAAGLVLATGGELKPTLANLARVHPVRGRLERAVITRAGAPVYVDYAHTPDAIESAIEALRPHARDRLIIVFGAGGDRDEGKRAGDGRGGGAARRPGHRHRRQSARRGSGRDPARHPGGRAGRERGGRAGARRSGRRSREAGPGDIVLLAGKGHEQGQIVGDKVLPFDDVSRGAGGSGDEPAVDRFRRSPKPTGGTVARRVRRGRRDLRFARGRPGRPVHRDEGRGDRRPPLRRPGLRRRARPARWSARRSPHPHVRVADTMQALERPRAGRRATRSQAQDRRRHRLGRQDRDQGGAVRGARPVGAGPGAPLGEELQQPYRRAAAPGPDAARGAVRRVRDGHEPCRRAGGADPAGPPARRHRHHDRAGAPRIFRQRRRDRRRQGRDLPGAGAGRHRDHPL